MNPAVDIATFETDALTASMYLVRNPDVAAAGVDPWQHYIKYGKAEGRVWDSPQATSAIPSAGALRHNDDYQLVANSALFNRDWYLRENSDVLQDGVDPLAHYLSIGASEGRCPSPLFNGNSYLEQNPDVAASGINPLVHYLKYGASEGRRFGNTEQRELADSLRTVAHLQQYDLPGSVKPFGGFPYDRLRPIAFLHIPKSAGMALTVGLREALAPKHFVSGFDRSLFGGFDKFASVHEEIRDIIYLAPRTLPTLADLICGHFAFSTLVARSDEPQVMTFLREPYSRLLSHWLFWRSHSDEQLAPWGEWGDLAKTSREPLADFLSCTRLAANIDNVALRMLLWPHPLIPVDTFIDMRNDEELVSAALIRLEQCAYTDIIENPELDARLQSWLGCDFSFARANETSPMPVERRMPLSRQLTAEALALMDRLTRLDVPLWEALAANRIGSSSVEGIRHRTTLQTTARFADLAMGIARSAAQ